MRIGLLTTVLLCLCTGCASIKHMDAQPDDGFVPLFNGHDLTGWEGNKDLWSVENGEIVGKSPGIKKNEFLATTASYGDFVMKFKFRIVNTSGQANSGMPSLLKIVSGFTPSSFIKRCTACTSPYSAATANACAFGSAKKLSTP